MKLEMQCNATQPQTSVYSPSMLMLSSWPGSHALLRSDAATMPKQTNTQTNNETNNTIINQSMNQ